MSDRHAHGVLLVLGAAVLWGTSGTAQSFAAASLSSYWVGAFRLVVAAAFFALWRLVERGRTGRVPGGSRAPVAGIALAAASMTLYNLAFFAGVRASSVALGTALALGSAPIWGGLLQIVLERSRPRATWWLGVGIAITGLALAFASTGSPTGGLAGITLCLLSGLGYALYARATATLVGESSPIGVTGAVFGLAAALALPFAWALGGVPRIAPTDIAVLLWLGVAATGFAYFLFALGLRHVTSATAVALGMAEPVAAVAFAIAVVGERPGGTALAGLAIVPLGLWVLVRRGGARPA